MINRYFYLSDVKSFLAEDTDAISGKMSQLATYPAEIQQMRTDLLMYSSELTNKEADIKQMENTLNARREVIKNEMKLVKSQK